MSLKRRLRKAVDRKAAELAEEIQQMDVYDGDITEKEKQLAKLVKIQAALKQPKISKEMWVEIIKVVGVLAVMALAICYDANDRVLPKTIEQYIPKPKL